MCIMPPKKQTFTIDQEFLLIDAVKNRPQLWDVSDPIYRRNDIKEVLWQEVADLMGIPNITAEIVRDRFVNMRTTFMNNEKRIRESKQRCSGKGTDEIYKPKWSFYTSLLFLKKACVQTESSSNLDGLKDDGQTFTTININEEMNNNVLANSIKNNIHFDSNLQKWVLTSDIFDASTSQALHQDASSIDLNPSLLEPTCSPKNKIERSSAKTNVPLTHIPASASSSSTSIEKVPHTSVLSEEPCVFNVTNSKLFASENLQNSRCTSTSSQSSNSTSISENKMQANNSVYVKRGAMKRTTVMEEAVQALKRIGNTKMSQNQMQQQSPPRIIDACEHLGLFIAARLREMEPERRLYCETEILKIFTTVPSSKMREENNEC